MGSNCAHGWSRPIDDVKIDIASLAERSLMISESRESVAFE